LDNEYCGATAFVTTGLTETALGAAGVFGAGFSGLAVLPVGVTIGFRAFVSWEVMGLGVRGEGAALTTRPLGRRGSTTHQIPSARQRARPASISGREMYP
jgi:hypothetical protein